MNSPSRNYAKITAILFTRATKYPFNNLPIIHSQRNAFFRRATKKSRLSLLVVLLSFQRTQRISKTRFRRATLMLGSFTSGGRC